MKLKKGSAAAKAYMAKLRAAKGKKTPAKKVSGVLDTLKRKAIAAKKNVAYSVIDKTLKNTPKKTAKDVLNRAKGIIKNTYLGSALTPNLLMELWFAVHSKESNKYNTIAKKLDSEGVSFSIQNAVSSDATEMRYKKNIDTFEVANRIQKIMQKTPAKKVGYKSDRTNILRTATQYIKTYKDKGYSRKEAIKNANLDAAFSIQGTAKKTAKKVGSTLKLHKKEMRLGMPPKTKSKTSNGYHKDTKSHNVNIRVISGVEDTKGVRDLMEKDIFYTVETLNRIVNNLPNLKNKNEIARHKLQIRAFKKMVEEKKKQLRALNKLINSNLK